VRVGISARAGARMEDVEREIIVELSFRHFLGCLNDQCAPVVVEQPEIVVRLGGGPFYQSECPNEWTRKTVPADREIENGTLSGGPMQRRLRYVHFPHRILLDSCCLCRHDEWLMEADAGCLAG